VLLVPAFKESSRLAAPYGIAVTGTMGITSVVFFVVAPDASSLCKRLASARQERRRRAREARGRPRRSFAARKRPPGAADARRRGENYRAIRRCWS